MKRDLERLKKKHAEEKGVRYRSSSLFDSKEPDRSSKSRGTSREVADMMNKIKL